jgi:heme exporter protein B
MRRFARIVRRDLQLALRHGMDSLMVVAFFVIAVVLFPLGVGPEPNMLARIAAGVVWVAALLASMLSLERLFQLDFEDGSLDLLMLTPMAPALLAGAKVVAHWLTTGLPLIVAAPILALLLGMEAAGLPVLVAALALGTPILSLVGAVGAALVLGARRGGVLLSLLVLPLYIPVLIFGVAAVDAAIGGFAARPYLEVLAGLLIAAMVLCPLAAAAGLRQALE